MHMSTLSGETQGVHHRFHTKYDMKTGLTLSVKVRKSPLETRESELIPATYRGFSVCVFSCLQVFLSVKKNFNNFRQEVFHFERRLVSDYVRGRDI